jgi:hypothetical protein
MKREWNAAEERSALDADGETIFVCVLFAVVVIIVVFALLVSCIIVFLYGMLSPRLLADDVRTLCKLIDDLSLLPTADAG